MPPMSKDLRPRFGDGKREGIGDRSSCLLRAASLSYSHRNLRLANHRLAAIGLLTRRHGNLAPTCGRAAPRKFCERELCADDGGHSYGISDARGSHGYGHSSSL